jgi:DNA-binding transcriptional regulator WhiA
MFFHGISAINNDQQKNHCDERIKIFIGYGKHIFILNHEKNTIVYIVRRTIVVDFLFDGNGIMFTYLA